MPVPVIVTLNVPAVLEVHPRVLVDVGGTVTLAGGIVGQVRPAGTVVDRLTVPENPLTAATRTLDDPVAPISVMTGDAETVKSGFPTLFVMLKVPAKPLTLAAVAAPDTVFPTGAMTAATGPVTVKSPTRTVSGTRWKTFAASVTFAVTTYTPGWLELKVHVELLVPPPARGLGEMALQDTVRADEGIGEVPLKPFTSVDKRVNVLV